MKRKDRGKKITALIWQKRIRNTPETRIYNIMVHPPSLKVTLRRASLCGWTRYLRALPWLRKIFEFLSSRHRDRDVFVFRRVRDGVRDMAIRPNQFTLH